MNIKRILATLLCFAMIMTSGVFTSVTYAEEIGGESDIVYAEDVFPDETVSEGQISVDTSDALTEETDGELDIVEESTSEGTVSEEIASDETVENEIVEEKLLIESEDSEITDELSEKEDIDEEEEVSDEIDELALQASKDLFEEGCTELTWKADAPETQEGKYEALGQILYVPEGTETIPDDFFKDDHHLVEIKVTFVEDTLKEIGEGAFQNCNKLSVFTASNALETIGDDAFSGCGALQTVSLNRVTSIGAGAFQNTGVTQITASNCTEVLDNAFNGCDKLISISLPVVREIGNSAFSGCIKLANLGLPPYGLTLERIGDYAFKNTAVKSVNWSNYVFPSDDENYRMGNGVFSNCTSLTYIALPAIETIPASTCEGCTALNAVIFNKNFVSDQVNPVTTKKIDGGAFGGCTSLKKISLADVSRVITSAFAGDVNLVEVKFEYIGNESEFKIDNDAFPNLGTPANLKMYGYIDAVHNYADKKGYTFVSMNDAHKITYKMSGGGFSISLSRTSARLDDIVNFTLTSSDGNYLLNEVEIVGVKSNKKYDAKLIKNGKYEEVFSFYMPGDEDVQIRVSSADIATVKQDAKLNFFTVDSVYQEPNYYVPNGGNGNYTIETSGKEFWIRFMNGYPHIGDKNWQWIFTSNNMNIVRVNELGLVTSVGEGTATITAQLKNTNVKIEQFFSVGTKKRIVDVWMDPVAPTRGSISLSDTGIPIISIDKEYVAKNAISFTTYIGAEDEDGDAIIVTPSYWSSVDTRNAVVASSKSFDNSMKITIPKGAVGETMIKAYALNPGETKVNANSIDENGNPLEEGEEGYTDNLALLIIRVVDFTPRLVNKTFDVDFNSSIGTKLQIIEVYDELGEIDKDFGLEIVQKKTVGKEVTPVTPNGFGLQVFYDVYGYYDNGIPGFYAQKKSGFDSIKENEVITYKNMFLRGFFDKGEKTEFYIPLGNITLSNKPLSPKLTTSGKINYFYGTSAEGLEKRSKVTVVQNLKNKKIDHVELRDAIHHSNPAYPEKDLMKENFDIDFDRNDNSKIYITMNESLEALKKNKNNQNVVSGYLYIYYVGYQNPVKLSFTVPTCNTAPAYQMSSTGVTMHVNAKNQKGSFYLFQKGDAKKKPISLQGMNITFNKSTTTGKLFEDTIDTSKYDDEDDYDSVITLTQDSQYKPVAGKAVIRMHHDSWAEGKYIEYTYKVSTVKTTPAAKAYTGSTATLNQQVMDGTSTIWFYSNQNNVPISAQSDDITEMTESVVTTVNKKNTDIAEALMDYFDIGVDTEPNTGKQMLYITVACPDPEDVPKGKYTYKITPRVDYFDGEPGMKIKPVSFAVSVTNTKIVLNMNSALVFNRDCAGLEEVKSAFTLKNLPSGCKQRDYKIDIDDAETEIVPPAKVTKNLLGDVINTYWIKPHDDETKNVIYFGAIMNGVRKKDNPFKYTYTIKNAKLLDSDDNEVATLADFKITVQMRDITSYFNVTASGSISAIDYYKPTCITYTANPKNFNTNITDIKLVEIDDYGNDKPSNEFFELTRDYYDPKVLEEELEIRDDKVAYVRLIPGKSLGERVQVGKKYKARLEYKLSARTDWEPSKVVTISVEQNNSSITLKQDVDRIYAGQGNRTVNVKIKPYSMNAASKIIDVDFKNGRDDNYYQAFTINRDETSGSATTMWQEVDGYNRPVFIDNTNPKKLLKMYVDDVIPEDETMYDLAGATDEVLLYYEDSSINKVVQYSPDTGEFYSGKLVKDPNDPTKKKFERTLIQDKYPTLATIRPDYYCTFSMTLTNSSALVLNKEHSVALVTVYEDAGQDVNKKPIKGTQIKVTLNVLK